MPAPFALGQAACVAPALRLAWVVLPEPLITDATATKGLFDDFSPTLEQLAFARMIERGDYQRQIRKARAVYRARRDRLVAVLADHLPGLTISGVSAGLHVLLNSRGAIDDRELERSALKEGVRVEALARYTITDRGERGLLLGYGRMHETAIGPAIACLSAVPQATSHGQADA